MSGPQKQLVPWTRLLPLVCLLVAWAGYRFYTDRERAGGWERSRVVATAIAFCICLSVAVAVFWYANLPQRESKP